jgi:hypothetical protein
LRAPWLVWREEKIDLSLSRVNAGIHLFLA